MKNLRFLIAACIVTVLVTLSACEPAEPEKLPIMGHHRYTETDTIYHTVQYFEFYDQDSTLVTPETFKGKVFVADFFFTSCTSICPIMKSQMGRVYKTFEDNDQVGFLSHSIDPEYDTVERLHDYAGRLGVKSDKWHFVTGDKDAIYEHANESYMVFAAENELAQDGIEHSGAFMLVDQDLRIRGAYDGTDTTDVDRLMRDIPRLLKEYSTEDGE